jgi:hypothetical protein
MLETPPAVGFRAKKSPTEICWAWWEWWRKRSEGVQCSLLKLGHNPLFLMGLARQHKKAEKEVCLTKISLGPATFRFEVTFRQCVMLSLTSTS